MTIKNIILSGGGIIGLTEFGIIKTLIELNIIEYKNIENIYCTSIGSLIGLIFILNTNYNNIEKYFIERPWENIFDINYNDIFNIVTNTGIISPEKIKDIIKPIILSSKFNLTEESTLLDLYNETKIKFNLITCNIATIDEVIINYITFPDIKIYEAILMTCGIPFLCKLLNFNNTYYIDGSIIENTPINIFLENENYNDEEILILDNNKDIKVNLECLTSYNFNKNKTVNIPENSNIFYIIFIFLKNIIAKFTFLYQYKNYSKHKFILINSALSNESIDLLYWKYAIYNKDEKILLINIGKKIAQNYFYYIYKKNNLNYNIYNLSQDELNKIDLSDCLFSLDNISNTIINSDLSNSECLFLFDNISNTIINSDLINSDLINSDLINSDLSNSDLSL